MNAQKILLFLCFTPLSMVAQNCINWQTPTGEVWQTGTNETWQVEKNECPRTPLLVGTLFPNPATDFIEVEGLEASDTEGSVLDAVGRLLYHTKPSKRINITALARGIYFLRTKNCIFKFIKI